MTMDGRSIDVDMDSMLCSEGEDCERLTGWTVGEWAQALISGRARAVRFALWLGLSRLGESVDFVTLNPDMLKMNYEVVGNEDDTADAPAALGVTGDDSGPIGHAVEATPDE
jgi:hypothetical protein